MLFAEKGEEAGTVTVTAAAETTGASEQLESGKGDKRNVGAHSLPSLQPINPCDEATKEEKSVQHDSLAPNFLELKDDPHLQTVTVRSCLIGLFMAVIGSTVAQIFIYKPVSLHVPSLFVQLMCFLIGTGCSKISGPPWWNPGPFSSKETAFASIMAVSASIDSIAIYLLSAQDLYFNRHASAPLALATIISSQLIGYGWAGVLQPLLIYSENTPYPSMLPSVALIRSLAGRTRTAKDQVKFFKKAFWAISIYEVFPVYVAPALQAISPWCLTLPKSPIVTQLFGGSQNTEGLGLFAFSFDWATLGSFGPLYTPFYAQAVQWVGVLVSIFIFMAGYRYNWFGGGLQNGFPFLSVTLVTSTGQEYNLTAAVHPNGTENKEMVKQMGVPLMATSSILAKTFTCASASAAVTSVVLYRWRDMVGVISRAGVAQEDPHRTITKKYSHFPSYGVPLIFAFSVAVALLASHYGHSGLSVIGMLVSLLLSGIVSISVGFIVATTGVYLSIIEPIQLVGGLIFPGNALANFWFMTFASTSAYQCINILKEFKLGQYLFLSPASVMWGQLVGSIVGLFTNYLVMELVLRNARDALLLPRGDGALTGIHILSMESRAISLPDLSGGLTSGQMNAVALGFWSQYYMRKYRSRWFVKYNDVLAAALLGGTEVTVLVMLIFFQGGGGWKLKMPRYFLNPQGPPDYCEMKN